MHPISVRCHGRRLVSEVGPGAHFLRCRTANSLCEEPVARPPARTKTGSARRQNAGPDNNAERRFLTGSGIVCLGGAGLLSYAAYAALQLEAGRAGVGRGLAADLLLFVAAFVLFVMGLWFFRHAVRTSPVPDPPPRQER